MTTTVKRLANLCLVLITGSLIVPAQAHDTPGTSAKNKTVVESGAKTSQSKADQLREQQLFLLRQHILARALDNVKRMDEPGLRLSARNQILTYLASDKALSDEKQALAIQVAVDALADFRDHGEELLPCMATYLANDLGAWIGKHRPRLTEEFQKAIKASVKADGSQRIRSLFELENGDILAAQQIRQLLKEQAPLEGLYFWLDELMRRKSREFEPLAFEIVARGGQGQISFETLSWVRDIYLRPDISPSLRKQFLATVVARTQPTNFVTEPAPHIAYQLLTQVLPFIQQSIPELYDRALNQSFAIRATLNEREVASDARIQRLKESANPVEDLVSEAETTKSKIERNELLFQAAVLALEKNRFDSCLNILSKVDVDPAATQPDLLQRSIDQLLKNFVKIVLAAKRTDLAEKGAGRIASTLTRVEALNLIIRYWSKANDKDASQRLLMEASKVAESGTDDPEKAKAFILLSLTCDQVDGSKKAELLQAGIKALNNLSKPDTDVREGTISYQDYVRVLDNTGYELIKGFKALSKQDENGALALVERLQKPDLKTFALIGILLGLDGL